MYCAREGGERRSAFPDRSPRCACDPALERRRLRAERLSGRPAAGARRRSQGHLGLRPLFRRLHGKPVPDRPFAHRRWRRHRRGRALRLRRGCLPALANAGQGRRGDPGLHAERPVDARGAQPRRARRAHQLLLARRPHRSHRRAFPCPRISLQRHQGSEGRNRHRQGRRRPLRAAGRSRIQGQARDRRRRPRFRHEDEGHRLREDGAPLRHRLRLRPGQRHPGAHLRHAAPAAEEHRARQRLPAVRPARLRARPRKRPRPRCCGLRLHPERPAATPRAAGPMSSSTAATSSAPRSAISS